MLRKEPGRKSKRRRTNNVCQKLGSTIVSIQRNGFEVAANQGDSRAESCEPRRVKFSISEKHPVEL